LTATISMVLQHYPDSNHEGESVLFDFLFEHRSFGILYNSLWTCMAYRISIE